MNLMPEYEVEKLEGTVTVDTHVKFVNTYVEDEDGNPVLDDQGNKILKDRKLVRESVERPAGWMVYFPRGHSIGVETAEEMRRLGFFDAPGLVDPNSDAEEHVNPNAPMQVSLKNVVASTARSSRRGRRAAQAGGE